MFKLKTLTQALACTLLLSAGWVQAETPQDFLSSYQAAAKAADTKFQGFSASRGEQFFKTTHGNDWSCASCHTSNPATIGKHASTDKAIDPLAPAANPKRFTNPRKVEKWFKRNCKDVLSRECTALEKGDILTFLMAIQ
ncbi:DUF1924 domain-containing protein [Thiothrix eikelboomii]|uniref:DUF1924 domain-containing protein n=1 Tax=Thiothrix eikelboomii TaxID=92487 RepID=UPI003BAE513C